MVDNEESEESNTSKIYERLKQEMSFLIILDDIWEAINLENVGVPNLKISQEAGVNTLSFFPCLYSLERAPEIPKSRINHFRLG